MQSNLTKLGHPCQWATERSASMMRKYRTDRCTTSRVLAKKAENVRGWGAFTAHHTRYMPHIFLDHLAHHELRIDRLPCCCHLVRTSKSLSCCCCCCGYTFSMYVYEEFSISQSSDKVGMGFNADHSFVSIDSHKRKNLRGNERRKPTDGV